MASVPSNPTARSSVALANDFDPVKSLPGFRTYSNYYTQAKKLQAEVEKRTAELIEAKKAPPGEFQRAHIHQINNILFRSGYELDNTIEEYGRLFTALVEELEVDWSRIKSNWIKDDEQTFGLQVIQAKCEFLRLNSKGMDLSGEVLKPLDELEEEIDKFISSNFSSGNMPDNALTFFTQMIGRLGEVLSGAYNLATEVPKNRALLAEPKPGSLSVSVLTEAQKALQQRVNDVPAEITRTNKLLPEGNWRKGNDLRSEIYAFAELLFPNGPIHRIAVKETMQYLAGDLDSRLRKLQMDKLRTDLTRVKSWLDTRDQHQMLLEQSIAMAKEGNYLQAEKFMAQTPAYFSDINYNLWRETAKFWIDQRHQLERRNDAALRDLNAKLDNLFKRPFVPMLRYGAMKRLLQSTYNGIKKEADSIKKYSKTDFYQDTQPSIEEALRRFALIEKEAARRRGTCLRFAFMEAAAIAIIFGSALAFYIHTLKTNQASLIVNVKPSDPADTTPVIQFDYKTKTGFSAKFEELLPGTYPLTINMTGYYPRNFDVTLTKGEKSVLPPVSLLPITGFLHLQAAVGDYDYEVYRVGEDQPVRTGKVENVESGNLLLRPGRYLVKFSQGIKQFEIVTDVEAHKVSEYLPDFLFATLQITSEPTGADVFINGAPVGKTPYTTRLAPIGYSVSVSLDDYQTKYFPIELPPGGKIPFKVQLTKDVPLTPLSVSSNDPDAPLVR